MTEPPGDTAKLTRRIQQLESELNDMTEALAHAWDQLDLFMRAAPEHIKSTGDIVPVLESIMDAVGSGLGAIFFLHQDKTTSDFFTIPSDAVPVRVLQVQLQVQLPLALELFAISNVPSWNGQLSRWLFMPMRVNNTAVGAIGVGRFQGESDFDTADARILTRITERASGQIAAANLAESHARELQVKGELQIAGLIQRSIQPLQEPSLPRLETAVDWQPAHIVGGDAWGWIMQPSGRLGCFLLDVAGQGLPAALSAAPLHTALKMALRLDPAPRRVRRVVNEDVYETYANAGLLATAAVITIDPLSGKIEHASAGHPPVLLRRGQDWQQWSATMPPLGVLPNAAPTPLCAELSANDLLILYSDGFSEIETEAGLWGMEGLKSSVAPGTVDAREALQAVIAAAERVRGTQSAHDDQTLFILRYLE